MLTLRPTSTLLCRWATCLHPTEVPSTGCLPEQNCGHVHHLCTAVCPAGPGCSQSLSWPQLQARYHTSWPPLSELVTRKQEEAFVPPSCSHFTRDEKTVPCWKQFIFNAWKSCKHARGLPLPSSALTENLWPSSHPAAAVLRTPGFHLGPRLISLRNTWVQTRSQGAQIPACSESWFFRPSHAP